MARGESNLNRCAHFCYGSVSLSTDPLTCTPICHCSCSSKSHTSSKLFSHGSPKQSSVCWVKIRAWNSEESCRGRIARRGALSALDYDWWKNDCQTEAVGQGSRAQANRHFSDWPHGEVHCMPSHKDSCFLQRHVLQVLSEVWSHEDGDHLLALE